MFQVIKGKIVIIHIRDKVGIHKGEGREKCINKQLRNSQKTYFT